TSKDITLPCIETEHLGRDEARCASDGCRFDRNGSFAQPKVTKLHCPFVWGMADDQDILGRSQHE
ncbi:hypothetical protein, partial [Micromonospora sp. XM-20-01]|uniref:hypothetical protein n=1 Tax=Micromonospora sp. XM-20-01 TaxID=2583240 RepID=UPI00202F32F1